MHGTSNVPWLWRFLEVGYLDTWVSEVWILDMLGYVGWISKEGTSNIGELDPFTVLVT
jgi:hypothetical protein